MVHTTKGMDFPVKISFQASHWRRWEKALEYPIGDKAYERRATPMLRRVTIRNYKSLAEVQIELGSFTVFIGPNGSGKSNFVDALRFVRDALTVGLDVAITRRRGMRGICRSGSRAAAFGLHLEFPDGTPAEYAFELRWEENGRYCVVREQGEEAGGGFEVYERRLVRASKLPSEFQWSPVHGLLFPFLSTTIAPQAWSVLTGMRFYHPLPHVIRTTLLGMPVVASPPLLEYGENLLYVLGLLKRDHPKAFEKIRDAVARLVPGLKGIDVTPAMVEVEREGVRLDLWQESDGTLRLLALATALYQEPPGQLLVIEEPELGVHPQSLGVLMDLLIEQSAKRQIILTTHSLDLLNRLPVETLRIMELTDGATRIVPLDETKRAIIEESFKMGDLLKPKDPRRTS